MIATTILPTTADSALRDGAAIQQRPDGGGMLILADADRSDFLQRMTTNNINALKPGQSAITVLTSPTARILFVFTVLCRAEDLLLLPTPGETAALFRHLRGQIFFMDKVKVRDASADYGRLRVMGATAGALLANLGLDLNTAPDGAWQEKDGVLAVKQLAYDVPGYEVIAHPDLLPSVIDSLTANGAVVIDNTEAYQARRVELGRPAPGHELTGDYSPLEAGLAWVCADDKGCYTGQEIIARQITYDKVTKTLVGLWAPQPLPVGATVVVDRREVGVVTSSAYSPALDAPIALAIVKRPFNAAGSPVVVNGLNTEVVTLPFVQS